MGSDLEKALNELLFGKEDICEVFFRFERTRRACRVFIAWLRSRGGEATPAEISEFSRDLELGKASPGFTYLRTNFYRTVLSRLTALGLLAVQDRFDSESKRMTRKYAPLTQWVSSRPPYGGGTFLKLAWVLASRWNRLWVEEEVP